MTGRGPRDSNERLEFLGDSVLGLVTSEFLYRRHPDEHEGQLTKTKSLLVSKAILSRRALKMGLGRYVLLSHSEVESGGRQRLSILADAFESVLGAVYLDQGFETARAFIHKHLLSDSDAIVADKRHTNYKSHLQEYVQSTYRTHPVYRIRSEYGPDHSKHFMVEVLVGKKTLGQGRGHNKKEAEQAAARDALDQVKELRRPRDVDADDRPSRRDRGDEDRPSRRGAVRDEDDEPRYEDDAPRSRRSVATQSPDRDEEPVSDVEADESERPERREGRRRRRRGSGREEGTRVPVAAEPEETIEQDAAVERDPEWDDEATRRPGRGRDRAQRVFAEPIEREPEREPELEPAGETGEVFEAEDDLAAPPVATRREAVAEDDRDSRDADEAPAAPVGEPSVGAAPAAASMSWGRSRRRGAIARPANAAVESVPLVEAAVDPFETEREEREERAQVVHVVPATEAQPDALPVVEVEPEDEADEESRQARIDEIEQALASFGRRSSKQGRRGRRR